MKRTLDFKTDKNFPQRRLILLKLKNTDGYFVGEIYPDMVVLPDNTPSEEPLDNIECWLELKNKEFNR